MINAATEITQPLDEDLAWEKHIISRYTQAAIKYQMDPGVVLARVVWRSLPGYVKLWRILSNAIKDLKAQV